MLQRAFGQCLCKNVRIQRGERRGWRNFIEKMNGIRDLEDDSDFFKREKGKRTFPTKDTARSPQTSRESSLVVKCGRSIRSGDGNWEGRQRSCCEGCY